MRVSLVINTLNRCDMLRRTLESLPQQRYHDFEVIVVNGPSNDGTAELLSGWRDSIKLADCPITNLAVSRNIGVRQAAGDVVAFIDDDAVPDPCWLERIVAGYDHPKVGAVGGFVLDSSGFEFQTTYIVADRFGGAVIHNPIDPTAEFNTPGAPRYAAHLGTNTTVHRSLLLTLGGFDEEFDYYLDETDLCLRIVDSGHVVKYVPNALVYHKFAASHLRNSDRVLLNRYPVLKNQSYFAIRHGAAAHGFVPAFESIVAFVEHHRREVRQLVDRGALPASAIADFELEASNAVRDGTTRAMAAAATDLVSIAPDPEAAVFRTFPRRNIAPHQLTICLLAERSDSVAVADLAKSLADLGHTVHRLSATATTNTVTLEQGVWVHRLAPAPCSSPLAPDISQALWQRSWTLMDQLRRIAANDRVDVALAPSTGCVATAALIEGAFPIVVAIDRPLAVLASADLGWMSNPSQLHDKLIPSLWWERRAVLFADGISAPSIEAVEHFEQLYELAIDRERVAVVTEADRRQAGFAALALFRRVTAETPPARWQNNRSAPGEGFSRRCTLSEFWVTAVLFPTLRAVAGGAVDWRAWARSLVLQNLAGIAAKQVVVFAEEPLPALAAYAPQAEVEQIIATPGELDAAVASLRDAERIYDAVYCIPLVDPYDPSFCNTVAMLGDVCRAGGVVHLIIAGGEIKGSFASIGRALAGHGMVPEPGWTALLRGTPHPTFAVPEVEPYLQVTINGVARPIAAIALRKLGVPVRATGALAGLAA